MTNKDGLKPPPTERFDLGKQNLSLRGNASHTFRSYRCNSPCSLYTEVFFLIFSSSASIVISYVSQAIWINIQEAPHLEDMEISKSTM